MISYDAGAVSYDLLTGRWSRLYVPTLLAEAGLATGHRVLDVATGTGEAATLAGAHVGTTGRVVGIDVSAPMLRIAASKVATYPVSLLLMDGQTLAFRDETFDAVVCQLGRDTLERLLAGTGLKGIRLTRETRVHRFASFEEYWQPFEAGGGRHGQLLLRLPSAARQQGSEPRTSSLASCPRIAS
jgi:SAM-dependent methyltransferase